MAGHETAFGDRAMAGRGVAARPEAALEDLIKMTRLKRIVSAALWSLVLLAVYTVLGIWAGVSPPWQWMAYPALALELPFAVAGLVGALLFWGALLCLVGAAAFRWLRD